jgi:hypothetical protein
MSTKLYVGNLPWDTTEATLRELFSSVGTVLSVELPVGRNGRSRGYGLVEFSSPSESLQAIQSLNGAWWRRARGRRPGAARLTLLLPSPARLAALLQASLWASAR